MTKKRRVVKNTDGSISVIIPADNSRKIISIAGKEISGGIPIWKSKVKLSKFDSLGIDYELEPEQVQPTGTCNFSRINKAQFKFDIRGGNSETSVTYNLYIFSRNINVLRIMGGVGNIVFAN